MFDPSAPDAAGMHPVLYSTTDKCRAIFVRCLAYVSGLAVLTALLSDLFAGAPAEAVVPQAPKQDWIAASRPHPAFAVSHVDFSSISVAYRIFRHPEGGRKDAMRWIASTGPKSGSEQPNTEIEIYRPGGELIAFAPPEADLAARMNLQAGWTSENAGVVASKFGLVPLLRFAAPDGSSCMAFFKNFDAPRVQISGWSCQPLPVAAQRTFVACTLDRLMLLSAGSDPTLATLFARAELRRTVCNAPTTGNGDWIAAVQEPLLRGPL